MFKKIQKWSAIILFGLNIFIAINLLIGMSISAIQEQYSKALWQFIGVFGWIFWTYLAYCWYSKNK